MIDRYAKPPSERNDRAELLGSDRHLRSDARSVANLLSLGVVDEGKVRGIIGKVYGLIDESANQKNARNVAALMRVVIQAAKLEISAQPKEHVHDHAHHAVLTDEQRAAITEARQLREELERRGFIVDGKVLEVRPTQAVRKTKNVPRS